MERPLLVYTTFPDVDTGLSIGEALVRAKLVACANVWPDMRSVYAWKGAVEHGEEAVGILKTRTGLKDEVAAALKARHPYETPIILFIEANSR
jgi:periplasmic divalent cation tolerance protein